MARNQELVVITKTYDLILWSCHHTGKFPRNHRFVLGERIERNLYDLLLTPGASSLQVLAHSVRFWGLRRNFLDRPPGVLLRLVGDESPNVLVKCADVVLHRQECLGILDGSLDLQPVADDPWIGQQTLPLFLVVLGDDGRIELVEGFPIVLSLFEDRLPTQARLRSF